MKSRLHLKLAAAIVAAALAIGILMTLRGGPAEPFRVGVLHSLSGTMAISARAVSEATLMAIDELNAAGGLLGRSIEPVVRDGACPGPEGDRHHAQTRGRVSVPRLRTPVSRGISAVSSRTLVNNAG